MKKFRGFFGSVSLAFVLLVSIFSQPVAVAARKRCPVRIPDSLLTLYLKSDLIVSGSITNEKFLKKTQEYDYGYYFSAEKNLRVSKTLKGVEADSAAFVVSDFKSSAPNENADEEIDRYAMGAGEEALFFLIKSEDDSYALADHVTGMKRLNAADLSVYIKRVEELKRLTAAKKSQMSKLAEWLVQLVEDPVTRADGMLDLNDSFGALAYESANETEEKKEAIENKAPIVLDKNFRAEAAPEIAKNLTGSQKQRLSTAFLNALGNDLLKIHNGTEEEQLYPDYRFTNLVGNWDKNYLAMSSFAFLLNTGGSDSRRIVYLMRVITNFLEDEELYEIVTEYESALAEPDDAKTDYAEKVEEGEAEIAPEESETTTENMKPAIEEVEEISVADKMPETSEATDEEAAKITFKEYRQRLLAKFSRQYGIVVSQGSASN